MISVISPGVASSVFFTPCGVISNAHARTTAIGNPTRVRARTSVTVQSGRPMLGNAMSATWRTTNATAPYMAMTRNTFRRLSSARSRW